MSSFETRKRELKSFIDPRVGFTLYTAMAPLGLAMTARSGAKSAGREDQAQPKLDFAHPVGVDLNGDADEIARTNASSDYPLCARAGNSFAAFP